MELNCRCASRHGPCWTNTSVMRNCLGPLFVRLSTISGMLWFDRLFNHRINDGKITGQSLRDVVAISQVGYTGRSHPDLIICTLPHEDFEGQIKGEERGRNHE